VMLPPVSRAHLSPRPAGSGRTRPASRHPGRRTQRVDPSVLAERLRALPGSEALLHRDDFDARNDLHLDAAASFLLDRFHETNDAAHLALLWELTQRRLREIARSITRQHALAADPDDLVAAFFTRLFTDVRRPQARVRRFLGLAHTAMRNDARNQLRQ